jgi:medium-chain acyl-[acyl-carrier-protein] hydrolase
VPDLRGATRLADATGGSWLAYRKPVAAARLRTFLFSYAGGGASVYRDWTRGLPATVDACPVQLPGKENRCLEPPYTSIGPLVRTLASVLQPYMDLPFAFFGYSMGALVSFELARELRRRGQVLPAHMIVAARRAPRLPAVDAPVHHLPDEAFIDEMRHMQGTPEEILRNPEFMQFLLPMVRADFTLCETYEYTPEPPLDCSLSSYGGADDEEPRPETLVRWREETSRAHHVRLFQGDHFFIHTCRAALLRTVSEELEAVMAHA